MPFRSESEQVRELIRRAEEQEQELRAENDALSKQVGPGRRRRRWLIVLLAVTTSASLLGYMAGALGASARASRLAAISVEKDAFALSDEGVKRSECERVKAEGAATLDGCLQRLEAARQPVGRGVSPHCPCLKGDPLCYCEFDRASAARALGKVEPEVEACLKPRRSISLHAKVTFAPDTGQLQTAVVDFPADLSETENLCIVKVLGTATVPAFSGSPASVGKSFSVTGPR